MLSKAVLGILFFVVVSLGVMSVPAWVFAGAITLPDSSIVEVEYLGVTFTCGNVDDEWIPGTYKASSGRFQSYSDQLTATRQKAKKSSGASKAKLSKQIKRLTGLVRDGADACASADTPSPDPTPIVDPTPDESSCFDSSRNTVSGVLQIPAGLTGNFSRGQVVWSSSCSSCHVSGSKNGNDYGDLAALYSSPMFLTNITSQQRADLAAYLNYPNC